MRIEDFIQKLRQLFPRKNPELSDEMIQGLIRSLEMEEEGCGEGCTCEDVFAVVDQYAEIEVRGEDAARLMPLLKKHLDECSDCREEYQALLEILQESNAS